MKLVIQVRGAVDDRRGTQEKHPPPDQPWGKRTISANSGMPEVVALVNNDESWVARWKTAPGETRMRPDGDRHRKPPRGLLPLCRECGRDDAGRRFTIEQLRDGQSEVGLSAADRVGAKHGTVFPHGVEQDGEGLGLCRIEPWRRDV